MHIVALSPKNAAAFYPLLLPESANAQKAGEPLTALGLVKGDTAIGAVAGYLSEGTFQISSLYVAPDYRRIGGGWLLMNALITLLHGYASDMEISFIISQPEHRFLQIFMEAMGFQKEPDCGQSIYLTTVGKIGTAPIFSRIKNTAGIPFSQLNKKLLFKTEEIASSLSAPMPKGGFLADSVDQSISSAVVEKGCIQAYVLFEHTKDGSLILSALWSQSQNPLTLSGLLRFSANALRQTAPPDTPLILQTVNNTSKTLLQTLLPDAVPISYTYHLSLSDLPYEKGAFL